MNRFISLLLAGFLGVSLLAHGQTKSAAPQPPKGRQAWIMATSLPPDVQSPLKILIGKDLTEVEIMKRSLGLPVAVPEDGLMYVVNPITDSQGKPAYERLVSIGIPDGVTRSLVILFPDPKLPAPLRFRAQVIDLNKFRGGDALFVNLTGYEVGVTLGEKKTSLKPGRTDIIATGDFEGRRNATVSYHYRAAGEKAWNLISSSTTMLLSDRREILIFSYDKQMEQIDYHGISFPDAD